MYWFESIAEVMPLSISRQSMHLRERERETLVCGSWPVAKILFCQLKVTVSTTDNGSNMTKDMTGWIGRIGRYPCTNVTWWMEWQGVHKKSRQQ